MMKYDIFLKQIGVSDRRMLEAPKPDEMPPVFNPSLKTVWSHLCEIYGPEWSKVIDQFLSFAIHTNTYPFTFSTEENNENVLSTLIKSINTISDFLNQEYLICFSTTPSDVTFIDNSFNITLRSIIALDNNRFLDFANQYGLTQDESKVSLFKRDINDKITICVCEDRYVELHITCNTLPVINERHCVSNAEIKDFICSIILPTAFKLSNMSNVYRN